MTTAGNSDKLDQLIESSDKLTDSNTKLALAMVEYQEREQKARRRFRITVGAVFAVGLLMMTGLLVAIIVILAQFGSSRSQITDCVQPTGQCYRQEQARTAVLIAGLVKAITTGDQQVAARAAACAPDYVSLPPKRRTAAIYHCIVRSN